MHGNEIVINVFETEFQLNLILMYYQITNVILKKVKKKN
jgi:hypothetical protein